MLSTRPLVCFIYLNGEEDGPLAAPPPSAIKSRSDCSQPGLTARLCPSRKAFPYKKRLPILHDCRFASENNL